MPRETPWGPADSVQTLAPGIISYSTPSHGGIELSPERNRLIPEAIKAATFKQLGQKGWYEEDCDWAIVAHYFPEAFHSWDLPIAESMFEVWCKRQGVTP